jgi:hypothetical protein
MKALVPFECPEHGHVLDTVVTARVQHGWVARQWCGRMCMAPEWATGILKKKTETRRRTAIK